MPELLSESQARALCERVLARSTTDGAEVRLRAGRAGNARFARNQITTSADVVDVEVTFTARVGRRSATVTFNVLDEPGIGAAVGRAEQLARIAPEDPELMPLLASQTYTPSPAYFESTADLAAAGRAQAIVPVVESAAAADMVASGFLQHRAASVAVANSAGLFAYHRATDASFTTTVRTPGGNGSGWAGGTHNDWGLVSSTAELAARAVRKARESTTTRDIPPGRYTVVLEPTAVGNLVQLLLSALDARAADEGRSFFSKRGGGTKLGERVVGDGVTLFSDPRDPDLLEPPFTDEGFPVGRTMWIENGLLRNLAYDRYWAERQGTQPTPLAGGIKMAGGQGTAADLVGSVERGLLVTRFWYIRNVDRRTLVFTGLTRDGTFLIENGRIAGAVKNLRFNESPVVMLNNVVAKGTPVRVVASESGGLGRAVSVPPLVIQGFRFTAVSDAV